MKGWGLILLTVCCAGWLCCVPARALAEEKPRAAWSRHPKSVKVIKGPVPSLREPKPLDDVKTQEVMVNRLDADNNSFHEICLGWCPNGRTRGIPAGSIQTNTLNEEAKPAKTNDGVAGFGWSVNW